jgi:hypothetical protein
LQYLTEDDVIAFYREVIGEPVLRYAAGLSSAGGRPQQSAFGEDAYPTPKFEGGGTHAIAGRKSAVRRRQ